MTLPNFLQIVFLCFGSIIAFVSGSDIMYYASPADLVYYTLAMLMLTWSITYGIKNQNN